MKAYRIISADSHAIEPPDLWQKYLPAPYASRGPRVVSGAAGDEWVCEGLASRAARRPMGAVARDEARARAAAAQGSTRYDADPGAWDSHRRVEHMRRDGVDAEVLYPNCAMTFIDDRDGIRLRDSIGVDRIMWSSDFPHLDSSWPESQHFLDDQLAGVPDDERRLIVAENCIRLYGLRDRLAAPLAGAR